MGSGPGLRVLALAWSGRIWRIDTEILLAAVESGLGLGLGLGLGEGQGRGRGRGQGRIRDQGRG